MGVLLPTQAKSFVSTPSMSILFIPFVNNHPNISTLWMSPVTLPSLFPLHFASLPRFTLFTYFLDLFIERECVSGGKGRERESQADSLLSVEPDMRLHAGTLRSRPEQKPRVRP